MAKLVRRILAGVSNFLELSKSFQTKLLHQSVDLYTYKPANDANGEAIARESYQKDDHINDGQ